MTISEENRETLTFGAERHTVREKAEHSRIDDDDILTFLSAVSSVAFVFAAVFFAAIGWFRAGTALFAFSVAFGFIAWFFVTYVED